MFPIKKSPKISYKFYCEKCNYKCSKLSEYNKHLSTTKHKNPINPITNLTDNIASRVYSCKCGKIYKHLSTLYHHKKKCYVFKCNNESDTLISTNTTPPNHVDIEKITELFKHMLTQNQDFMKDIVEKVIPNIGNTTNTNSHNTTNNQFNIQMFLNEHCKEILERPSDFLHSIATMRM